MPGLFHSLSLSLSPTGQSVIPQPEMPPQAPTGFVRQSATNGSLTMAWTALPLGVVARIQMQIAGGDWSVIDDLAPVPSPLTLGNLSGNALEADTAYDVRIRAENSAGESYWVVLAGLLTQPPTPMDLSVMTGGYGVLTLSWNPHAGYGYQIYRDGALITSAAEQPFSDMLGLPAVTSAYQLAATNSAGRSDLSPAVSGTTGAGSAPSNYGSPMISCDDTPVTPGSVLTLSRPGAWSGDPAPTQTSTQWYRDDTPIYGQSPTSYTAVMDDIGHGITYVETYSNALATASASSNSITVNPRISPTRTGDPVIDAVGFNYNEGGTLYVVSHGSWLGNPTSFSYTWLYNGTQASSGSDTLLIGNAGSYQCVVTASNEVGTTDAVSNTVYVSSPA